MSSLNRQNPNVARNASLSTLLLTGLAAWRIAYALTREEGPYDLFARLRHWAGIRYDAHSEPVVAVVGWKALPAGALSCLYCCSVWSGLLTALLVRLHPGLLVPLAASALAITLDEGLDVLEKWAN
jgi:hypothetical protein